MLSEVQFVNQMADVKKTLNKFNNKIIELVSFSDSNCYDTVSQTFFISFSFQSGDESLLSVFLLNSHDLYVLIEKRTRVCF